MSINDTVFWVSIATMLRVRHGRAPPAEPPRAFIKMPRSVIKGTISNIKISFLFVPESSIRRWKNLTKISRKACLVAGFAAGCKKGGKSVSEETRSRHAALQLAHAQRAEQKCGQSLTAGFKTARMASSKTLFRSFWLRAEHSTYFSAAPQQNSDNRARARARAQRACSHARHTFDLLRQLIALVLSQRSLALLLQSPHLQNSINANTPSAAHRAQPSRCNSQ